MAIPFFAFTSLDGQEFAFVCRSEPGEDRPTLLQRAEERIYAEVSGIPASMFDALHRNLQVIPHYKAIQAPYQQYLGDVFNLLWVQRQADKAKLSSR